MLLLYASSFLLLTNAVSGIEMWEKNPSCPIICTCQLEHLTETAIYRFMQKDKKKQSSSSEVTSNEYNDVFYEENLESELLEDKQIVRSAICIIQTETEPLELISKLPEDLESLTLIQGYHTGNKSIKFSYMEKFENLLSLELVGPNSLNKLTNSRLMSEIDRPLPNLKYLNLESILIKNSKEQIQNFVKEFSDDPQTFEYVQKIDSNVHPLTMIVQQGTTNTEEVLPYEKYKAQDNEHKMPLFVGFRSLFLLRITRCELNNVHWTMFDGLHNLQYLTLESNNLRFIPPFAFYGTPNLKTLSLAHNNLLDIQITDLAGLLELEFLDLSFNNFSQLSELSLPPFPKLKLANFGNNPITVIFPNTFEVMNTTDSLVIGSDDVHLSLMANSFQGLNLLKALTLNNLQIALLKRDLFVGMPNLSEMTLTGNITEIEYDTFLNVYKLKKLFLSNCKIRNISMDAFIGLENLEILDLSRNDLEYLPPAVFDQLINIKEIYLNDNHFKQLPPDIFSKIHTKMIRLCGNPWHCSCEMSEWKPMIINKIKQKVVKQCDLTHDKNVACSQENRFAFKYVYENRVAPKCSEPKEFLNWNVFHVMRRLLKCPEYKPKIKKVASKKLDRSVLPVNNNSKSSPEITTDPPNNKQIVSLSKIDMLKLKLSIHETDDENNELNVFNNFDSQPIKIPRKIRKYKKNYYRPKMLSNRITSF